MFIRLIHFRAAAHKIQSWHGAEFIFVPQPISNYSMKHLILSLTLAAATFGVYAQKKNTAPETKQANLSGLSFRALGPAFVSGRISDLAVNPGNHDEYYVAVASGGVFKTTNHGNTFQPIFDAQGSYSIGCITIDPNNSHTIWVGSGENNNQRSVAYGDGVYKSLDDGKTWKNMGLKNSEHISKIIVKPGHPNEVYVAAYGPLWSDGGDRGIYKTNDGGETWERILHVSDHTGFSDLWMDPRNPDVLYAAAHQRRRHVWTYLGGGPESAVYKTTDGGKNWRKIMNGLPSGDLGRIALAIAPSNPDVVYAMVEGYDKDHGGFYRSNNLGESWTKQSDYFTSGNYYIELIPDPLDENKVFSMDTWLHHTEDGGKTFKQTGEKSKHVDNHAMWINPNNTNHWLVGCDGGLYETWDAAENWKFYQNLSITQFYRVAVDNDSPFYNVYGGTQDNNTIGGPSRTVNTHGISNFDWYITRGGDGFEPAIDPENSDIIYSQAQYGWLVRYNRKTGERVNIKPVERKGETPYRWNWDAPLLISPHNSKRLYFAANKVFRSDDRGDTWEVISDDLSAQIDRSKLTVMGTTWGPDAVAFNQSTSHFGNLVALDESPVQEGLLYAGSDDGLIHVTDDNGATWKKFETFTGVPNQTYINDIMADLFDAQTVYVAFNNHKNGDFKPYILKSTNKGQSWTSISGDLPERGSVYALAQDHENQNLLFAGTEFGIFFTANGGKNWIKMGGGLPTIAIRDIDIQRRENDLVLASFGRGFYVMDDYSPLRNMTDTTGRQAYIFPIKDALAFNESNPLGTKGKASQGENFFTTPNPPVGAVFRYYLNQKPMSLAEQRREKEKKTRKDGGAITFPPIEELKAEDLEQKPFLIFEITDANGDVVSRYKEEKFSKGINENVWDFRLEVTSPVKLKEGDGGRYGSPDYGPLALPGTYAVRILKFENGTLTPLTEAKQFEVKHLHDSQISKADHNALMTFIGNLNAARKEMRAEADRIAEMKKKLELMQEAIMKTPEAQAEWIEVMDAMRIDIEEINQAFWGDPSRSRRDMPDYPGILNRVEGIAYNIKAHTEAPTQSELRSLEVAKEEFQAMKVRIDKVKNGMSEMSEKLTKAGAPYFGE